MKKLTLLLNIFLFLSAIGFAQTDPSVTSITVDNSTFAENGGVSTITATISAVSPKKVTIPLTITGTADINTDYSTAFDSKGEYSTVAGGNGRGSANNQFYATDFQFVSSEEVYILDNTNSRVMKWKLNELEGEIVISELNNQWRNSSMSVDSLGNIYLLDSWNDRVMKWLPGATDGILVAGGNGRGSAYNQFNSAKGMQVDSSGNIFIADTGNHRIMKWRPEATEGIIVAGGNGDGSAINQFSYPTVIRLDSLGNIYVLDSFNPRLQKKQIASQITIPAGSTTGSITFTGIEDTIYDEIDETIIVTPSTPKKCNISFFRLKNHNN